MGSHNQRINVGKSRKGSDVEIKKSYPWYWPWVIVATVILGTAVTRIHLLSVPLERDEGEYAYAGQLILQGIPPYVQVYNMKLPGVYAAYAAIMAVLGQSCTAIHLGLLVINATTILLLFLLVKHLIGPFAGVFAAAAFAVMSFSRSVLGIFAHAEHFVILFAVAGLLLLVLAMDRNSLLLLVGASVSLGISFLMKQHAAGFIVFAGLCLLAQQLRRKPFALKSLLLRLCVFVLGVSLPFGVTCLILWRAGAFEKFWFWTFTYARQYVSTMPLADGLENLRVQLTEISGSAILIWILAGIGLIAIFVDRKIRSRGPFVVGLLLFSFLSTCPGLYFREHYFVLLLPAIALLSGVGLLSLSRLLAWRKARSWSGLAVALLGVGVVAHGLYQQRDFLLARDPLVLSHNLYGLNPFPESLKIAEYVKANSADNDTIAILGSEPQILFYAHRRSATGYIYAYPLMESHPYAVQMQKEMIRQVEAAKPKFLIFVDVPTSWLADPTSNHLIIDWFQRYQDQYYKMVGVADMISMSQTIYRWNKDAANYNPRSEFCIRVLQRKSDT